MRNQEEKIEKIEKLQGRICVRDITFLLARLLIISFFVAFFVSSPFMRKKKFASENGGDWRPLFPLPSSVYGPDIIEMYFISKGWYFSFNLIDFAFLKILRE